MKISKEELPELIEELSEILESADVYLGAVERVVESLGPAISRALKILLEALNKTHIDLEPELNMCATLKAQAMRRDFTSYVKAGFTKDQAFKLVLASIKPFSFAEVLKGVKLPESKEN